MVEREESLGFELVLATEAEEFRGWLKQYFDEHAIYQLQFPYEFLVIIPLTIIPEENDYCIVDFTIYPSNEFSEIISKQPPDRAELEQFLDEKECGSAGEIEVNQISKDRLKIVGLFHKYYFKPIIISIGKTIASSFTIEYDKFSSPITKEMPIVNVPFTVDIIALTKQLLPLKRRSKRGPITKSDEDKLKAVKEWDDSPHNQTLEDYLSSKFGTTNGVLNVKPPTFHSWRQELRKKGLYP